MTARPDDELDLDTAEALGYDGTGRDGLPPVTWGDVLRRGNFLVCWSDTGWPAAAEVFADFDSAVAESGRIMKETRRNTDVMPVPC